MASQSQQWKDIQISKEDAQNIIDAHLKDINDARPIVDFRELPKPKYRWVAILFRLSEMFNPRQVTDPYRRLIELISTMGRHSPTSHHTRSQ